MQTIWFPAPVVLLFRRLVNVVGTLSISHHYLKPVNDPADRPDAWTTLKSMSWVSWVARTRFSLAVEGETSSFQPHQRSRPPPPSPPPQPQYTVNRPLDAIHRLMHSPLYDPIRVPRNPIALCHGLYGFDVRGPSAFPMLQKHYWSNVLEVLKRKVGAEVIVTSVPGTGSIASRAERLDRILQERASGRAINFLAHSMGGLDCRHLISRIKPTEYTPLSLTTVATPHRGSPFMDWCNDNLGIGKVGHQEHELKALSEEFSKRASPSDSEKSSVSKFTVSLASLPSSFTTLILGIFDSPAYANLSTSYLNKVFNPNTPDDPNVRYFSVAGRLSSMSIFHPLWITKMVLDGYEEKERERMGDRWRYQDGGERWGNDGLVTIQSARWGEFLGILEECDHWELRGARGLEIGDIFGAKETDSSASGNGWLSGDWGRVVRALKREEKQAREAGAETSERRERERVSGTDTANAPDESAKEGERGFGDDVVKASTERVSAVFDWIVDQVPSRPPAAAPPGQSLSAAMEAKQEASKAPTKSELDTKADLERFYVALCRKLYDEGL